MPWSEDGQIPLSLWLETFELVAMHVVELFALLHSNCTHTRTVEHSLFYVQAWGPCMQCAVCDINGPDTMAIIIQFLELSHH